VYNYIGLEPRREAMHWQFGEMKFDEMKRNTSNWSNFGMLLRRAGLTASAGLSCLHCVQLHHYFLCNFCTITGVLNVCVFSSNYTWRYSVLYNVWY